MYDASETAVGSLSLEVPKNNPQANLTSCPNAALVVDMILHRDSGDLQVRKRVRCKKWDCPYCGKINAHVLRRRLRQGFKGLLVAHGIDNGQFGYRVKLFTLTVPGQAYRDRRTPAQAEVEVKLALAKLLNLIRHHYPLSHAVWVRELQRDGYPHIHLILMGDKIAPRGILDFVRRHWTRRYGMGNVDVRFVEDEKRLVNYVTKYVTKGMQGGRELGEFGIPELRPSGALPKWYRVFGMSQFLRMLCNLEKPEVTVVRIYKRKWDDDGNEWLDLVWESTCCEWGPAEEAVKKNLQELLDFFDSAPFVGEQRSLF